MKKEKCFNKIFLFLILLFSMLLILIDIDFVSASSQKYSVKVTEEHPFLLENGEYSSTNELKVGDYLKTVNGKKARITKITDVVSNEVFNVYNLDTKKYDDFILPGGVVVHNSNVIKDEASISCSGGDCLSGKTLVRVEFPDGKVQTMAMKELYARKNANPCRRFKIMDYNGNYFLIDIKMEVYTVKMYRITIEGGKTITVTENHLIYIKRLEYLDGKLTEILKLVPAKELQFEDSVITNYGPRLIRKLESFNTKCQKVYKPVALDNKERVYSLDEFGGPYIMNPMKSASRFSGSWRIWTPDRTYARIMSKAEAREFDRTGILPRLSRLEGELVPTFDANSKRDLNWLAGRSSAELRDFYLLAGGTGNNDVVRFFKSSVPPDVEGILMKSITGFKETKFPMEIKVEIVYPPF